MAKEIESVVDTVVVAKGSKLGGTVTLQKRTWTNYKDAKSTFEHGEIYAIIDTTTIDQPRLGMFQP